MTEPTITTSVQPAQDRTASAPIAALAARYLPLVYASALRQTRDPATADDITQAVFLVLARRTANPPQEAHMAGWLLKVTRYAVQESRRAAMRRHYHEHQAAAQKTEHAAPAEGSLLPLLDDALLGLPAADRELLSRRYLAGQPVNQLAGALGISENTASKRLGRALDRLRALLHRRGFSAPVAALAAALGAQFVAGSSQASAAVLAHTLAAGASPSGAPAALANLITRRILMAKVKLALGSAAAAAALLITAFAGVHLLWAQMLAQPAAPLGNANTPSPTPAPIVAAAIPAATQQAPRAVSDIPATVPAALVTANNRFGLDLFHQFAAAPSQNAFFSPYSISTALAMTWAGARNETANQMAKVLHFSELSPSDVTPGFAALQKALAETQKQSQAQFTLANSLWPERDPSHPFVESYLQQVQDDFASSLTPVNYKTDYQAVARQINAWVADKTKDKIKDLLHPDDLDPLTRMVLINTIYFKASWSSPFVQRLSTNSDFHLADGTTKTTTLMHQTFPIIKYGKFDAAGTEFQMLSLNYFGDPDAAAAAGGRGFAMRGLGGQRHEELSFVILLPSDRIGLDALEKNITADQISTCYGKMDDQRVELFLPKFKIEARYMLKDALTAMGVVNAFIVPDPPDHPTDPNAADFSGMNGYRDLYITKVIHQTFIDLDEKGTEAAAATAVVMGAGGARVTPPPAILFRADHPFLFMIRENTTGSILFLGRLANPSPADPNAGRGAFNANRGPTTNRGATNRGRAAANPIGQRGNAPPALAVAHPADAARSTLDLITQERDAQPALVGGSHAGLVSDLATLQAAAQALTDDDTKNPATTANLASEFSGALSQAIVRSNQIANRGSETQAVRDAATDLAGKFKAIAEK